MWIISALLIAVAMFSCWVMLTLIVTLFERRYVWILEPMRAAAIAEPERREPSHENPYQPPASPVPDLPFTTFAATNSRELESLGYQYLGCFRDARRGIYQIRSDVWISSDRYVLGTIDSGSLMAIQVNNLSLLTLGKQSADLLTQRFADSTICIESFTNGGAISPNIGGTLDSMLFPSASARDADQLHRQRLAFVQPHRFSEDPLGDYHRFRIQEAHTGRDRGLCRFVDDYQNVWLPTFAGALRIVAYMYSFNISRQIYSDRRRLKRMVKRHRKAGEMR